MGKPQVEEHGASSRPGNQEVLVRTYTFGQFRVDVTTYELRRDGELVAISPKAFDTLLMLIRNRERAVAKDELMDAVWPDANVTEDSLTHCISTLRRALEDNSNHPIFIATVPRRGYRFISPVAEVTAAGSKFAEGLSAVEMAPGAYLGGSPAERARRWRVPWSQSTRLIVAAAITVLICAGIAVFYVVNARLLDTGPPPLAELGKLRFTVEAPDGTLFNSGGALSPNGRYLAFVAQDDRTGRVRLGVKALDSAEARVLAGTEGASQPFWSPDSRFLGFFADGKLKRIGLDNTPAQVLTVLGTYTAGGSWSPKGVILFANLRSGLFSVSDSGGTATPVTALDPATQEVAHRWPQFLPDGEHFLFFKASAKPDQSGTYVGSLHSGMSYRVLDAPSVYAPPGYLIYLRDHLLVTQPFDGSRLRLSSSAKIIDTTVLTASTVNDGGVTAADNGLLAFGGYSPWEQIKWFDRSGHELATLDTPTAVGNPALSPDQKQVLVNSPDTEHGIWLVDLDRAAPTLLVPDGTRAQWSPDGTRFVYTADRIASINEIFMKSMTGRNEDVLLLRGEENKLIDDWSPDGSYIVYASSGPKTDTDLWILPTAGDRKPRPFLQTSANELQGQISPDGHWIAYTSDESGVWEVYLQSFPQPGVKRTISIGGGTEPHWRRDGRELFYLSPDSTLMSVNVTLASFPTIGRPVPLFRAAIRSRYSVFRNHYAVSADGKRFLICAVERKGKEERVTVLANWRDAARRSLFCLGLRRRTGQKRGQTSSVGLPTSPRSPAPL
jgi:DNA-binding winged helix-turn-helix (wHTH) protein/Tol biopolymer transport system component